MPFQRPAVLALLGAWWLPLGCAAPPSPMAPEAQSSPTGPSSASPAPSPSPQRLSFGAPEVILDRRVDDLEFGPEGRLYALSSGTGDRRVSLRQADGAWEHIEGIGEHSLRGQAWLSPTEAIVVGDQGAIWRLRREGATWQRSPIQVAGQSRWLDVAFATPQLGYLVSSEATYRSLDGGLSWAPFATGGGTSLVVGGQGQVVLNNSTGASRLLKGEESLPLRPPNAEGDLAQISRLRWGGGRWWGKQGSTWAYSPDLQSWQRPGPNFMAPGRSMEGSPTEALPFDHGAYLNNPKGFFYWPGQGLGVSLPTEASYSASEDDVVGQDGSLYLMSATQLQRLPAPAMLNSLLP